MDIQDVVNLYKKYGYNLPLKAIYHKPEHIIPFSTDFRDGEIIELWNSCGKNSSVAYGSVFYINKKGRVNLVNIKNLTEYKED